MIIEHDKSDFSDFIHFIHTQGEYRIIYLY